MLGIVGRVAGAERVAGALTAGAGDGLIWRVALCVDRVRGADVSGADGVVTVAEGVDTCGRCVGRVIAERRVAACAV